jgi:hypothetical protein
VNPLRLLAAPVLALATTVVVPALVSAPAHAAAAPCVHPDNARYDHGAPHWRHYEDHPDVQRSDLQALPTSQTTRRYVAQQVEPVLPGSVTIPTYVHVIKGRHRGERVPAGPRKVRRVMRIVNNGYSGGQSATNTPTRYRFVLKKIDYRRRDGWYHAYLNGPRDSRMKQALHRGDAGTLNIYINGGGPNGYPILGWSRFPWQYQKNPRMDGVNLNVASLPGGRAKRYNLGDTAVHEIGHWMGLFHTFQGGCSSTNDMVADTPAEAEPSYYCDTTRDTCPTDLGLDPVHNFMDYSYDSCMYEFTRDQVFRMDSAYEKWRQ